MSTDEQAPPSYGFTDFTTNSSPPITTNNYTTIDSSSPNGNQLQTNYSQPEPQIIQQTPLQTGYPQPQVVQQTPLQTGYPQSQPQVIQQTPLQAGYPQSQPQVIQQTPLQTGYPQQQQQQQPQYQTQTNYPQPQYPNMQQTNYQPMYQQQQLQQQQVVYQQPVYQQPMQAVYVQQPYVQPMGMMPGVYPMGVGVAVQQQPTPHPIKSSWIVMQNGIRYNGCCQRSFVAYVQCGQGQPVCCYLPNDNGCCTSTAITCKSLMFILFFILAVVFATYGSTYSETTTCNLSYVVNGTCSYTECIDSNCNSYITLEGTEYSYHYESVDCPGLTLSKTGSCNYPGTQFYYEYGTSKTCYEDSGCSDISWISGSYYYKLFGTFFCISIAILISIFIHCRVCLFVYHPYCYKRCCCYRE